MEPAPDESLTKWQFGVVDGIVLARVDKRQGGLTAAGDWVQSDIGATIVEVFKAPKGANWTPGARIAFEEEGGEIQVNGVRVNAVVPPGFPVPLIAFTTWTRSRLTFPSLCYPNFESWEGVTKTRIT